MKQEINKEMDSLLRRLARSTKSAPDANGKIISGNHMDADELSAYAEHALPPAARARYTDHLADCTKCREIVAGLSISLGLPVAEKVEAPAEKSPFKSFLMGLFSPRFARYAIPTLALVGVVGIGVIVFRQQSARNSAALQNDSVAVRQVTPAAPPEKVTDSVSGFKSASPQATPAAEVKEETNDRKQDEAKPGEARGTVAAPPPTEAPVVPVATPLAAPKVAKAGDVDSVTRAEPEVEQKRPDTVARQRQTSDDREGDEQPRKDVRPYDGAAVQSGPSKSETKTTAVSKKNEVAQNASPAPASASGAGRRANADKAKEAAEVRSVAGRKFYREGSTWIDTNYESGRATTNVSRGSDQYRALVADEPRIRTIADTLGGEVIVVWKGRAYKIR